MEPLSTLTDTAVVARTLVDTSAFAELVLRYEAKLARYIQRLGIRTAEDAEDILQEIFIKVYKNLNAFDSSLSFSSWVYRIAHNETVSFYRKKRVRPEGNLVFDSEELLQYQTEHKLSAEDSFALTEDALVLTAAMRQLDAKYQDPIILRYFEHKEYEEISDILKIPIGSVGTLIHRGKKKLQEHIAKTTPEHHTL